ncbi:hypothetical protein Tco_1074227 [Tanacetum coccineum]
MGDANPIRTLRDYSKPSHEGYRNTIELPVGNNVDYKTSQRYPDVPTTSRRISLRSIDSFQGLTLKSPLSWHRSMASSSNLLRPSYLALMQPTQVNKITSSCEICSGPHDTQFCMENLEQAFVKYASSRTDEAGGKWYTFKPEQNNLGDSYTSSWKSHPNLSQSNLEGLEPNFMASQDARLSKFEADFKRQQSKMTNKIKPVLKAITDRIAGALLRDTVKNSKLNVNTPTLVLSTCSYPTKDPQYSSHPSTSINVVKTCSKEASHSQTSLLQTRMGIGTEQTKEPKSTLKDEF